MKDIRQKLVSLLKTDYATPQLARIAKKIATPSTTIHYNIKRLEQEKAILTYKAVFDYKKIGEGFCSFVLVSLSPEEYADPEKIARDLAKQPEIESVDICTGDWEIILKVRTKDQDAYYDLVRKVLSRKGISKTKTLMSMKQVKTEFVSLE